MKSIILFVTIMFVLAAGVARADYPDDRKAAVGLAASGKNKEALEAFTKLAQEAPTEAQRNDALEQATICAESLRQFDAGMALARQITAAALSKHCQMRLLLGNRQWQDVVALFGAEDFSAWPEGFRAQSYHLRGQAYLAVKDGPRAEADLTQAAQSLTSSNDKGLALVQLGDVYRTLLNDPIRAVETYRKAYDTDSVYKRCQASIGIATVLCAEKKFDEALRELQSRLTSDVTSAHWRAKMLSEMGRTLVEAGRKAEAVAMYREALAVKGVPEEFKSLSEDALKSLGASAP
jgi:tetratricopeptide (TPR) repeat protein